MDNEKNDVDVQNGEEEIPEVTVEFKLTEQDFFQTTLDISMRNKSPMITVIICSLILSIIICRFIDEFLISLPSGPIIILIILVLASLIFTLFIYLFKYQARNNYKNNKEMQQLIIHKIYKDKIITTTDMAFVIRRFDEIYKFAETKTNFLLYISPNQAIMLPKIHFKSEEDLTKTKELFSKIPVPALNKLERTANVFRKIGIILIVIPIAIIIIVLLLFIILQFIGIE